MWNDDFHHSAMVALTGHNEAYYSDYRGAPQEFISAVKRGFLYQGQYYSWQRQRRGSWTGGLKPAAFIHFLQNHDQVANFGLRRANSPVGPSGSISGNDRTFLTIAANPHALSGTGICRFQSVCVFC